LLVVGLVVGGFVVACLEVDPIVEQDPRGGARKPTAAGSAERVVKEPPSSREPVGPECFPASIPPKLDLAPAAERIAACSSAEIDAITTACTLRDVEETAACKAARATHATCAECIFGTLNENVAKVVMIVPGATYVYQPNLHTCLDHTSGTKGCGDAYLNNRKCVDVLCERNLRCEGPSYEACIASSALGKCPYQVPPGCQESAAEDGCMRTNQAKEFFTLIIEASCGNIADAGK
jgi:hypothetical protein